MYEISNVLRSVRKPYLRASYHVYKIGCFLVRDISLPVAQLFVIAIENILRGVCGQSNKKALAAAAAGQEAAPSISAARDTVASES